MKITTHEVLRPWRHRNRLLRGLIAIVAMGCMLPTVGCHTFREGIMSPFTLASCSIGPNRQAKATAHRLWRERYAHCYGANSNDIRKGFVDGFVDTAEGGNGCTPLVPPSHCCGIGKQPNAKCWFQGYPLGVAAARSCGASEWAKTAISPDLAACMANEQCTPGCVPCQPGPGVMHSGMMDDGFNGPPVPIELEQTQSLGAEAPLIDQGHVGGSNNITDSAALESADVMSMPADNGGVETIDLPKAEVDEISPSDADKMAPPAPIAPIERGGDLTSTRPSIEIPVANPRQKAPVVGSPILMPEMAISNEASTDILLESALGTPSSTSKPVVGDPVDLPNIQVGFDMEGVDWLFGELDIAQAVLAHQENESLGIE